jgi:hypothetical protein
MPQRCIWALPSSPWAWAETQLQPTGVCAKIESYTPASQALEGITVWCGCALDHYYFENNQNGFSDDVSFGNGRPSRALSTTVGLPS